MGTDNLSKLTLESLFTVKPIVPIEMSEKMTIVLSILMSAVIFSGFVFVGVLIFENGTLSDCKSKDGYNSFAVTDVERFPMASLAGICHIYNENFLLLFSLFVAPVSIGFGMSIAFRYDEKYNF